MLSAAENKAVVAWLRDNSSRPMVALARWAELFDNLRTDTGEIVLTRDELAEQVRCRPTEVSELVGEKARASERSAGGGGVWRGMRGPEAKCGIS